jgi:hypothetical protein
MLVSFPQRFLNYIKLQLKTMGFKEAFRGLYGEKLFVIYGSRWACCKTIVTKHFFCCDLISFSNACFPRP